jgi:hypothetical protein
MRNAGSLVGGIIVRAVPALALRFRELADPTAHFPPQSLANNSKNAGEGAVSIGSAFLTDSFQMDHGRTR